VDTAELWTEQLRDVGYVLARALLNTDEVHDLRCAFGPAASGSTQHVALDSRTPSRGAWLALTKHPAVTGLFDALLGDYDVTVHGRDPGPGAGGQGLHADRPAGRLHAVDAITVLWMLDDFTYENGATRVVPRSHVGAAAVPRHVAQPGTTHPDEVVVTGHSGDALIFDAHLWHSGRENTSRSRRRAVQMAATRSSLVRSTSL
jgi:hypothetical protein